MGSTTRLFANVLRIEIRCGPAERIDALLDRKLGRFVINPGPHHAISHSSIWNVTEEELHKLEKVSDYHRVGDCEIYFYNADDR
jgi:hypothetical protein